MKRSEFKRKAPLLMTGPAKTSVPVFRPRKCNTVKGGCGAKFTPTRSFVCWCSPECGLAIASKAMKKKAEREAIEDRKRTRQQKQDAKKLPKLAKEAQDEVNRYVRWRDFQYGCISCDKPADWDGQWHASHFRSVGAASAVRFNLWNIHKACWICNKLYSGRIDAYRPVITAKIGAQKVAWLEAQNQVVKYEREYLARLKSVFAKKAKRAEARARNFVAKQLEKAEA